MFNKIIASMLPHMPKKFIWIFSKKYIAGETLNQAMSVSKELNSNKVMVTIDLLGEFIKDLNEADENKEAYFKILESLNKQGIDGNISIKPTFFGLLIDKEKCYENIREVITLATKYNNFVRIDMEDSPNVDAEIEIYNRLRKEFPNNVGLVLQAYLHRTKGDIEKFIKNNTLEAPLNFRLCKGIYNEPAEIAYKEYQQINDNYIELLELLISNGCYVGIATHDKNLISEAYKIIDKYKLDKNKFEFQMLYGVTPELRKSIVDKGFRMRVYIPYGKDWFGYSTRRLKENPKMTNHVIKSIFVRG